MPIHSGGEGLGISGASGGAGLPAFYLEWHTLGSACSIMSHLVSLLCHGTFERFPKLKVLPVKADITGLEIPNKFVVGFGMDVYGYWRNLPGLWAIRPEDLAPR